MINIVLLEPEIPANTGNIGRTCVATGSRLHLIEPLGFDISEKAVRRAGMDYWKDIDLHVYKNYEEFLEKNPGARPYMATTKGQSLYSEVDYEDEVYIMFGKESAGIPEEILMTDKERCIRIPMLSEIRSLNLSNSVAIVTYEVLRQKGFSHMQFDLICLTEKVTGGTVIARENYLHHKEDRDEILNKYSPVILLDLLILGVIIAVGIYFGFLTYLQKSLFFGAFTLVLLLFLLHTTVQMSRWALFAHGLKRFGIVDPEDLN